jgi:hypothetical protein
MIAASKMTIKAANTTIHPLPPKCIDNRNEHVSTNHHCHTQLPHPSFPMHFPHYNYHPCSYGANLLGTHWHGPILEHHPQRIRICHTHGQNATTDDVVPIFPTKTPQLLTLPHTMCLLTKDWTIGKISSCVCANQSLKCDSIRITATQKQAIIHSQKFYNAALQIFL